MGWSAYRGRSRDRGGACQEPPRRDGAVSAAASSADASRGGLRSSHIAALRARRRQAAATAWHLGVHERGLSEEPLRWAQLLRGHDRDCVPPSGAVSRRVWGRVLRSALSRR
eukprot:Amastigsp_a515494_8.p2 type:complete len:112 gc:universal Amastigsp_a515494_8:380-715(+)